MKYKYLLATLLILCIPLFASYYKHTDFLETAEDVNAGATATNGSEFTSEHIPLEGAQRGAITITFTRAAGSTSTVDFEFEVSYDGGVNWSTYEGAKLSEPTNKTPKSGTTVEVSYQFNFYGISHIRLWKITNNDGANNLTSCNARLSI